MGKASSRKGARAERDIAELLTALLDRPIRRMLGAGRADDIGDLDGLEWFTAQVANRANLGDTLRYKPRDCERQQENAGNTFGVTFMKLPPQPGGKPAEWRAVMTPEQFCVVYEVLHLYMEELAETYQFLPIENLDDDNPAQH